MGVEGRLDFSNPSAHPNLETLPVSNLHTSKSPNFWVLDLFEPASVCWLVCGSESSRGHIKLSGSCQTSSILARGDLEEGLKGEEVMSRDILV